MKPKTKRNVRRAVVCLTALAALFTLTGCSPSMQERADTLSDNIVAVCNEQVQDVDMGFKMEDFKIIGTDVEKSSFDFDVSFNGIASFSDSSIGYTSVNYTVPSTYFVELDKDSSHDELYNVFDYIVENLKPDSISVSPVNDLIAVNDAFVKNEPALFEGYKTTRGLVYNLSEPQFDDSTRTISFNAQNILETRSGKASPGFGLGIGFNGSVGLGVTVHISSKTGTFIVEDNYKLTVDEQTYTQMKENPSLVFDYCVKAINNKDNSKITAERVSTTSVTYNSADLLHKLDIDNLNKELTD